MKMFLVLTGLALLQMIVFASYKDIEYSGLFEQTTFAGLGQATQVCSRAPNFEKYDNITFIFSCNSNYVVNSVFSAGIFQIHKTQDQITDIIEDIENVEDICYETLEQREENLMHNCVNYDKLYSDILDNCYGFTQCYFNITLSDVWLYDAGDNCATRPDKTAVWFA